MTRFHSFILTMLITLLLPALTGASVQDRVYPVIGLAPDDGYPVWLADDVDNYLPLRTSQTSGLDWVFSDTDPEGNQRHWLIMADDSDPGGIHLVSLEAESVEPVVNFHGDTLTPPPPGVSLIPVTPGDGYDWEGIAYHPWSETVFIAQEGALSDIAIYIGQVSSAGIDIGSDGYGRAGETGLVPGYITNIRQLELPGFSDVFGPYLDQNVGIEGIACSEDRLFLGLESPHTMTDRFFDDLSTVMGIWKIDSGNPGNIDSCELIASHDTSGWTEILGDTVETICGLDALDNNHVVGLDRDNQEIFSVTFSDTGEFTGGRIFYLDTPGPGPLESDGCEEPVELPRLVKPSLESIALVPSGGTEITSFSVGVDYSIYVAVDPWAPGWALLTDEWRCENYESRLTDLLPAIYRYTVPFEVLFPGYVGDAESTD